MNSPRSMKISAENVMNSTIGYYSSNKRSPKSKIRRVDHRSASLYFKVKCESRNPSTKISIDHLKRKIDDHTKLYMKYTKHILVATLTVGLLFVISRKRPRKIKKCLLSDLVGNTPLIYLRSLSELCGCDVYVFILCSISGKSRVHESHR